MVSNSGIKLIYLQVHEVNVGVDIKPDPVAVKINDIVCWIFRSLRQYGVSRVQSIDQIAGNEVEEVTVPPRYVKKDVIFFCFMGN